MHQNLAIILQQLCYDKISFAVLVPERAWREGECKQDRKGLGNLNQALRLKSPEATEPTNERSRKAKIN